MDKEKKKATIHDVANLAKVSIKTVSRVINQEPNVRQSTIEKVRSAAKTLNYQPSSFARSLAGHLCFNIGLVYSTSSPSYIFDVQSGVLQACKNAGFELIIHPCFHQQKQLINELVNLFESKKVDGLLLLPPHCDDELLIQTLESKSCNFARMSPGKPQISEAPYAGINDFQAAKTLTQHIIKHGHTKIGIIKGPKSHGAAYQRTIGFEEALKEANLTLHDSYVGHGHFDFSSGKQNCQQLLSLKDPPTAIFACNDAMAAGAMHYAMSQGKTLPKDLSIVGFDDSPTAERLWPSLTTVKQPAFDMANTCAQALIKMIRKQPLGQYRQVFDHTVVIRNSVSSII